MSEDSRVKVSGAGTTAEELLALTDPVHKRRGQAKLLPAVPVMPQNKVLGLPESFRHEGKIRFPLVKVNS